MINKCIFIGRLTKDPDARYTQSGNAVTTFRIAVNRNFLNNQGEREADFIPIQAWRTTAENCAKYLQKGQLVAVSGRLQTRSYEQDGQRRFTWEIIADEVQFLERSNNNQKSKLEDAYEDLEPVDPDDELPF